MMPRIEAISAKMSAKAREFGSSSLAERIELAASAPRTVPPRMGFPVGHGRLFLYPAAQGPTVVVEIWQQGYPWIRGKTPSLDDVVQLAIAWESGMTLSQAQRRWPFLEYDELAAAHENGSVVAVKWDLLERDRGISEELREVINLASGKVKLRMLFPWVGQVGARFGLSRCTGYPYTDDIPVMDLKQGSFRLTDVKRRLTIGEYATAGEAVHNLALAVPDGYGPAIIGTADDLADL